MAYNSKFLRSLFDVAHVEFQKYDLQHHKLIFSSGVALKVLGYTLNEYVAFSSDFYREIVHPDDWPKIEQTCYKLIHSLKGEVIEMTIRLRKKDGNYIWAYSRQMVLENNAKGDVVSAIREVEDVTFMIELQDQLKEKLEQLQAVSYKNSHLLRSPVASIIGLINMVEEHGITSEHNMQIFEYLKQAIEKLDQVVHEINDTARV